MPEELVDRGGPSGNANANGHNGFGAPPAPEPTPVQAKYRKADGMALRVGRHVQDFWDSLRVQSLLWTGHVIALGALGLLVCPHIIDRLSGRTSTDVGLSSHIAALLFCGVGLMPPLLARLCYSLMNKRAAQRQVTLRFPDALPAELAESARACWWYECRRVSASLSRAESFAGLWGLSATVALVAILIFLVPPLHTPGEPFMKNCSLKPMSHHPDGSSPTAQTWPATSEALYRHGGTWLGTGCVPF